MDASAPAHSTPLAASPSTARFAARLAGSTGHDLSVDGYWRPVIGLAEAAQRGWALSLRVRTMGGGSPRVISLDSLNVVDRERVNLAALRQGLGVLAAAASQSPAPVAIVPIAWACAKSERTRRDLLRLAGQFRAARQVIPFAEIVDLEPGASSAAVAEVVASLKPIFGGVLVRLASPHDDVPRLMGRGFAGATLDAGRVELSPDRPILSGVVALLKAVGPTVMLQDLNAVAALEAARDAGVAWASLDLSRSGWHLVQAGLETLRRPPDRRDD